MSEQVDLQQLFRKWRAGDERSGHVMAQRFSDWYYAVSASRLGDREGRPPLERACRRFAAGITEVTDPHTLTEWAHGILSEELSASGVRLNGGDQPNALTEKRSPTELLRQAATHMQPAELRLLVHTYSADYATEALIEEAEAAGGYPMAALQARYALKRALRDHLQIGLGEIPTDPKFDLAPLPLYEAGRMSAEREERAFERWMLTDLALCRDLAEFAAFALALRGGAIEAPPEHIPQVAPASEAPASEPLSVAAERTPALSGRILPKIIAALVVLAVLVAGAFIALKVL